MVLLSWSSRVGDAWYKEFLAGGAQVLKRPVLLRSPQIEVEDVRVSAAGNQNKPKIDLVLFGERLRPDERSLFLSSVQNMPADVMILGTVPGH